MSVSSILDRARALVYPVSDVSDADLQAALSAVVTVTLSRVSPQVVEEDDALVDGELDLSDLDDWSEGYSAVRAIEYPVDEVPQSLLDSRQWRVRQDSTEGATLMVACGGTETVRVHYTAPHSLDLAADTTTLDLVEEEAAASYVGAEILDRLANRYAQKRAAAVAGETYDGPDPEELRKSARALRAMALEVIRGAAGNSGVALVVGGEPSIEVPADAF